MSDIRRRLDALSAEQRELLAKMLEKKPRATEAPVPAPPRAPTPAQVAPIAAARPVRRGDVDFGIFFFSEAHRSDSRERYRFLLDAAKRADELGFSAIWTPERHFNEFGGLYPSPAVLGAAIAGITKSIEIRAGSVVLPLHHPVRVAEDWAVVDNLSEGRVGLSFASGWHPDDFIFSPGTYRDRRDVMFDGIETLRRLWRGEEVTERGIEGKAVRLRVYPQPIRRALPIWVTSAKTPETWRRAGAIGANVLTGLLEQNTDELAANIRLYRASLAEHGHADTAIVSCMLHTFVWDDPDVVVAKVRQPLLDYLGSHMQLYAKMLASTGSEVNAATVSEADLEVLREVGFQRYFHEHGLFGTPASCEAKIEKLRSIGVDEIACLMDFGVPSADVLQSLEHLAQLRARCRATEIAATS
jgi:natural product biosynthesis luciferase-like monooxygenase protein